MVDEEDEGGAETADDEHDEFHDVAGRRLGQLPLAQARFDELLQDHARQRVQRRRHRASKIIFFSFKYCKRIFANLRAALKTPAIKRPGKPGI